MGRGFGRGQTQIPILAWHLACCVTQAKSLNFSEPPFPHLCKWKRSRIPMRTEGGGRRRKNMSGKLWPMGASQHPHPHWVSWDSFRREMLLPHSAGGETDSERPAGWGHHKRETCLGSEPVNSSLDTPHQGCSSNRCETPFLRASSPGGHGQPASRAGGGPR